MLKNESEYWSKENSNKNSRILTTQRDYMAGIVSIDYSRRYLLPKKVVQAHDKGAIHIHDLDYLSENAITNCSLINLEDMLQNGTVINNEMIEKPHRFITAMTIATQIMLGVSSNQYGGLTITVAHLAPFVRSSYDRYKNIYISRGVDEITAKEWAKKDTEKEIEDGVQTFNYQLNSMTNTNGQSPFCSVFFYLNENPEYTTEIAMITKEFFKQRIKGIKNKAGVYQTQAFPKLLYVLDENNITEDSEYWWLTKLAAECTAKRMVPDYISAKVMKKEKGDVYGCMGCRSFLTPDPLQHKYWGRFNIGVSTLNLPYIAMESIAYAQDRYDAPVLDHQYEDCFFEILDNYLELCHKAQKVRLNRLENVTSDVAPLLWQHGAFARLKEGESLHNLLHNNYCTSSIGYAGLYEAVLLLTGESHSKKNTKGYEMGIKIMQHLNDTCNKWKEAEDVAYSLYGSPIESTTYKFAKALQNANFKCEINNDILKAILNKNYVTNSYHVTPAEPISAFDKIDIEAEYQKLSPGGAISYVEVGNLQNNIPAVLQIIQYIYDKIMYCELNTKSDYCYNCGFDGEIELKKDKEKYYWQCPCCGNIDENKMAVTRRVCGYLGTNGYNQGRLNDIADRYIHLQ
jgi:ribonucleoside-triphosphate reductase